jgi:hypothetical protein
MGVTRQGCAAVNLKLLIRNYFIKQAETEKQRIPNHMQKYTIRTAALFLAKSPVIFTQGS